MKTPAPGLRGEILVLFYAVQHRSAPVLPKLVAAASLVYLLSPIDLIPDFIPFAGWLDDLIIVPLLLRLSYRLLPATVVRESRIRARGQGRRLKRLGWTAVILIIAVMAGTYWYYHTKG